MSRPTLQNGHICIIIEIIEKTRGGGALILAIDVGNTNITIGGFCGDELRLVLRLSADRERTDDEYAMLIDGALRLHGADPRDIDGAVVSSVVPPLDHALKKAIERLFSVDAIFVGPGIKTGIGIQCDMPSSVGADIVAASVAVHFLYKSPALIIDMGTATKMTVLNKKGAFIGTSIAPGVMMGLNGLAECTAQLPRISLEVPRSVIEKNTIDCMRSGVVFGNAAMVDGMIDRIERETGESLDIYATGGMASLISPLCDHKMLVDEDLVLKGLNIIYNKNKT